jgi:predicted metal-dependent hydrolase
MTAKHTPDDVTVSPRDIHFDTDAVRRGYWLAGDPVGTAIFNAMSLTFPDGERLFIDAVKHYRPQVSGKLTEDVRGFIAQEAIHSREHHVLNQLIDRQKYPVAEIEGKVRERVALARSRGPIGMLISTIALEHFTAMLADMHAEHQDLFNGVEPDIERLWRWHAMEETEHKAVAYDVFMEVTKGWSPFKRYMRRCVSMVIITYMFTRNIAVYAARLLEADGYTPKAALKAVKAFLWKKPGLFRRGWRLYLLWFRPGFHPWCQDNRALVAAWKAEFDALPARQPEAAPV